MRNKIPVWIYGMEWFHLVFTSEPFETITTFCYLALTILIFGGLNLSVDDMQKVTSKTQLIQFSTFSFFKFIRINSWNQVTPNQVIFLPIQKRYLYAKKNYEFFFKSIILTFECFRVLELFFTLAMKIKN